MFELARAVGLEASEPDGKSATVPPPDAGELVAQLQAGGDGAEAALGNALEAGLEALEAVAMSTPRKQRKAVKLQCARLEAVLEDADEYLLGRLAAYDSADLAQLGEKLAVMQALRASSQLLNLWMKKMVDRCGNEKMNT